MRYMIEVIIPKQVSLIVIRKYTSLYNSMRKKYGKSYPRAKLIQNINNALSINGNSISIDKIRTPIYNKWKEQQYKVISYGHWFYALILVKKASGEMVAKVVDALYEGDYHNDKMQTKPYESKVIGMILEFMKRLNKIA